jgi:two-component system, chemotaxis family, CheB/CheR fusion protein
MPKTDQDKPKILSENLFPVVGVGASAGGLKAFKKLVKAIPEKSGMAYILVQHLSPDHSSALSNILQRETHIPVHEIRDNVHVKPDNVYVIPANKILVANDGILQLSPRPSKDEKNRPIDIFFSSLAEVHQGHAIGVVLSGNGTDGTIGLKNIKCQGGITFAQDLDSATYDSMPQSAINAEVVDFVLAPEKMPRKLLKLNRALNILSSNDHTVNEELQSLNEELETSKEELQSTNEDLINVNRELYDRNEQLNQARWYAEAIVTTIHEPLLVLSQDFKIISANKSFYKDFVITEKETIGQILFNLQNKHWNIPRLRSQLLRIQRENEKFLEWEITYKFPLAGERTICFNAQPIQKENGENWILLAFNDITSRKKIDNFEKKNVEDLKKILENMPQITSTVSPDGSVTYFNQFFLNYSGMTFAEALGRGWEPVIKPEMVDEFTKSRSHSIATGEDFNMELLLKRKSDNMYRWHLWRLSAIRNVAGIITSWVGAAIDIHDLKTKEESKDEFMSIASHELKTPLTAAKAYIQLLQIDMEETNDKNLIFAQKANASIDKLNYLIAELLDVSKIQNGKFPLNITTFNFNKMLSAAIEGVQYGSLSHSIIKTGEINQEIKGDKERLQQVVINLLSNAVKYSLKANKVFINVVQEDGEVKVSVKDSGIGIRKENLGKIFERYYREEERAVHFQGLGIGLYISYEIIQRHNGKLWAESKVGQGSTFHFTIPI